jgi:hypothetical protein
MDNRKGKPTQAQETGNQKIVFQSSSSVSHDSEHGTLRLWDGCDFKTTKTMRIVLDLA